MKIILASKSPRRRELMNLGRFEYEILVSDEEEKFDENLSIEEQSKKLAYSKAKIIFDNTQGDRAIIGADTIVVNNNEIYGKPKDRQDAIRMLKNLQGKEHKVYTSIAVLIEKSGAYKEYNELHETKIFVKKMSDYEISKYITDTNPYDKAGAYAIQGEFSLFIEKIEGSYTNVVGLPIERIYEILKENGILEEY
ncbi:MAG: Maf family protein [Candidatus Scatovivens sp.]